MDFSDALKAMKEGKKVKRTSRENESYRYDPESFGYGVFICDYEEGNNTIRSVISGWANEYILAEYWEIVED